jgi:hypothetical protein
MAIILSLLKAYAKAIYIDGTKKFSEIKVEYVEPVKQHAISNYTEEQIYLALEKNYINLEEYNDTMAYKI